jgi:hypothetical protein
MNFEELRRERRGEGGEAEVGWMRSLNRNGDGGRVGQVRQGKAMTSSTTKCRKE